MLPGLEPGWFLLMNDAATPSVGQVVVATHPRQPSMVIVKRVAAIEPDGTIFVLSDNAEAGSDSRHFGPLETGAVLGVATLILDHPRRPLQNRKYPSS